MKRFLIELCELLILCLLFPVLIIVFGAMDWSEPPSKFLCISGDRKICVCKDCGEIVDDIFFEHEGMGYK